MKTYKVLKAWEGVEVGDEVKSDKHGWIEPAHSPMITPIDAAIALHLGFIEEVGAVKEKFVPKEGELYWYLSDRATCYSCTNLYDAVDQRRISIGNSYRTESDCAEARERVLKAY